MAKKILITGGSGFIGTYLARALIARGHHVIIYDLVTPTPTILSQVQYIQGDVRNLSHLKEVIQPSLDAIFHFAAIVSVPICENQPHESFKTNVLGTQNVIECVHELIPQKKVPLFFASSAAVYGDLGKPGEQLGENALLPKPTSFYGLHKFASEQLIRLYVEKHHLEGLSFRFFNVYGEGQNPESPYSGVITLFKKALQFKQPIKLYNHGNNSRDFIHVSEIARACVLALEAPASTYNGAALNLCTGQSILISELLLSMEKTYGPSTSVELLPPRLGDIQFSCGDPREAGRTIGFYSKTDWNFE